MQVRSIIICVPVALAAVAGCSSSVDVVRVQGVKLTPQSIQLVVGDTQTLAMTVSPANATDRAVTWESTDTTVAKVNASGRITARSVGAGVFITVVTHDGSFQASTNLTVNP